MIFRFGYLQSVSSQVHNGTGRGGSRSGRMGTILCPNTAPNTVYVPNTAVEAKTALVFRRKSQFSLPIFNKRILSPYFIHRILSQYAMFSIE